MTVGPWQLLQSIIRESGGPTDEIAKFEGMAVHFSNSPSLSKEDRKAVVTGGPRGLYAYRTDNSSFPFGPDTYDVVQTLKMHDRGAVRFSVFQHED